MAKKKKKTTSFTIPKLTITRQFEGEKKAKSKVIGPFLLKRSHSSYYGDNHNWQLKVKTGKSRYKEIGSVEVSATINSEILSACISSASMDDEAYLGMGLMKRSYQLLANHYNGLESDPNGYTSDDAQRVWKSLKAKKLPNGRYRIEKKGK